MLRLLLGHGVLQQPHLRGQLFGAHALLRVRALQLLQLRARLRQRLVRRLRAHLSLPTLRAQLLLVPRDLALQVLCASARRGEARRGGARRSVSVSAGAAAASATCALAGCINGRWAREAEHHSRAPRTWHRVSTSTSAALASAMAACRCATAALPSLALAISASASRSMSVAARTSCTVRFTISSRPARSRARRSPAATSRFSDSAPSASDSSSCVGACGAQPGSAE